MMQISMPTLGKMAKITVLVLGVLIAEVAVEEAIKSAMDVHEWLKEANSQFADQAHIEAYAKESRLAAQEREDIQNLVILKEAK